jgi:hypothetical protein
MWGVFHQAAELVVSDQHIEVRDQLLIALSWLHARPAVRSRIEVCLCPDGCPWQGLDWQRRRRIILSAVLQRSLSDR